MAKIDVFEIDGFPELNRKLKQLPDRVKRTEVLKIFRRLAKPIVQAYSQALPVGTRDKRRFGTTYPKGTLSKSVKTDTVPSGKSGGNPSIAIRPGKKGKYDSFYKFMVIPKGTKTGSISRGSRVGKNTVVEKARDKAAQSVGIQARKQAEEKTAKYIQRQIDKLGNV